MVNWTMLRWIRNEIQNYTIFSAHPSKHKIPKCCYDTIDGDHGSNAHHLFANYYDWIHFSNHTFDLALLFIFLLILSSWSILIYVYRHIQHKTTISLTWTDTLSFAYQDKTFNHKIGSWHKPTRNLIEEKLKLQIKKLLNCIDFSLPIHAERIKR